MVRVLSVNSQIKSGRLSGRQLGLALSLLSVASIRSACTTMSVCQGVPAELIDQASITGIPGIGIRFLGDEAPKNFAAMVKKFEQQQRASGLAGSKNRRKVHNMLVISGGGSNGAFGAGSLNGWTFSGKRPDFTVVTGVSTGALIAPFAFLGPRYYNILKEFYTKYSTKDILQPNFVSGLLGGSAVGNSGPLEGLIAKYLTSKLMRENGSRASERATASGWHN